MKTPKTEIDELVEKFKWKLKDVEGEDIEEAIHHSGNEVFVDMHNGDLDNLKDILQQAQTQTKLECLKEELEFLVSMSRFTKKDCECDICISYEERITKIQQEIREIENEMPKM